MRFYQQTDLFNVLISAAQSANLCADPKLQAAYNKKRFSQAMRALRSRNVFLYTDGARTSTDLNNINTIYTQAAGERLLLLGYADNFRYGAVLRATIAGANPSQDMLLGMHRVRIVGKNERVLVDDLVPAQAGVSGQPRYTQTQLVAPTILEPDEQIAVDLGYDQAAASISPAHDLRPQAFIFFCLRVKDKLTTQEQDTILQIQGFINQNCFQRAVRMNCAVLASSFVGVGPASVAGDQTACDTPPASVPTLITGIGTTLQASTIKITDTADGYSFSLNRPMQSSALNMPDYESSGELTTFGAPTVAPIWASFFPLPVPHLLIKGAQLHVEIVVGGDAGAGPGTILEESAFNQLVFTGLTV